VEILSRPRALAAKRDAGLLGRLPGPIRIPERYKRTAFVYLRRLCFMYGDSISILPSKNKKQTRRSVSVCYNDKVFYVYILGDAVQQNPR